VPSDRKVVLVTRHSRIEELTARFHTLEQARFYVEHLGADFSDYMAEHEKYLAARRIVESALASCARLQLLDRGFLPTYLFAPRSYTLSMTSSSAPRRTPRLVMSFGLDRGLRSSPRAESSSRRGWARRPG